MYMTIRQQFYHWQASQIMARKQIQMKFRDVSRSQKAELNVFATKYKTGSVIDLILSK